MQMQSFVLTTRITSAPETNLLGLLICGSYAPSFLLCLIPHLIFMAVRLPRVIFTPKTLWSSMPTPNRISPPLLTGNSLGQILYRRSRNIPSSLWIILFGMRIIHYGSGMFEIKLHLSSFCVKLKVLELMLLAERSYRSSSLKV